MPASRSRAFVPSLLIGTLTVLAILAVVEFAGMERADWHYFPAYFFGSVVPVIGIVTVVLLTPLALFWLYVTHAHPGSRQILFPLAGGLTAKLFEQLFVHALSGQVRTIDYVYAFIIGGAGAWAFQYAYQRISASR